MKKDASWYKSQIKRAKEYKNRIGKQYEWKNLKDTLNTAGLYVEVNKDSEKQVESDRSASGYVNWPWAFKESFIPAVFSRQPEVYVYPRRSLHKMNAMAVQANINKTLTEIGFAKECKRALLDTLVFGHGWLKLGWYTRYGQLPEGANLNPDKPSTIDVDMDLKEDRAYSYRISPEYMHVDPEATRYEDIRWVAQEYYAPYEDVKSDPTLKNTKDASTLSYSQEDERPSIFERPESKSEKREWCRLYEIWDREGERVLIYVDGCDKFSRIVSGFPYRGVRGFPFKFLAITEAVDQFYPPSPILAWLPMVNELSFIRAKRMEHMSKMVNKIINQSNNVDEKWLEALQDPNAEYVEVMEIDKIKDFRGLQPDPNLYASEERIEATIRDISGFSELISGSIPYSKLTATTSQIAAQNSTIRFQHATQIMGEFVKECAKDLFYIIRDYQEYPVTVRIADNPQADLKEITRDQIEGEFDFRILVEDMSRINKQERIKMAYDKLVALAPFKQVRIEKLIEDFLTANGDVITEEYLYPPMGEPKDPMYENSLMSRGIKVPVNPREDHELHLRVHNEWVSSPAYQQLVAQFPAIQQIVSAHIQMTNVAFEEQRGLHRQEGQQKAGVSPSIQQGQQLASSAPQGAQGRQSQGTESAISQISQMLQQRGGR